MGYQYTVQGWCQLARPIDLATVALPPVGDVRFTDDYAPHRWACVVGCRRDHVAFATEAKHVSNYYVALLASLVDAAGGGTGLITVTGEITYDGKGRIVVAHGGRTFTLPTRRSYDPRSPWSGVFEACGYLGRQPDRMPAIDVGRLRAALDGRSTVHGWLHLPQQWDAEADARTAAVADELASAVPGLTGGTAFMRQYCAPYVLVGQDRVDAAAVAVAMARATADRPESYGLLYGGTAADAGRSQVPVMVEAGRARVLPPVSLDIADEPDPGPARSDAYEGLAHATVTLPLRWAGTLGELSAAVCRATGATPEPAAEPPTHVLLLAGDLTLTLWANTGWYGADPDVWPFQMELALRHEADPPRIRHLTRGLVDRLRAAGIDAAVDLAWPDRL